MKATHFAILAGLSIWAMPASAATFTFETATATASPFLGGLTSYSETHSGLTMTLARPGSSFDIVANVAGQGGKPAGWGRKSLAPFVDASGFPFVADFSAGVKAFSVQFGDYGADFPDILTANFFSGAGGTGTLLGTASVTFTAAAFPSFATLSFASTTPFSSVSFIGGTAAFPHSVFYDNFTASNGVPEPATWVMLLLGVGLIGASMRRGKQTARVRFAF